MSLGRYRWWFLLPCAAAAVIIAIVWQRESPNMHAPAPIASEPKAEDPAHPKTTLEAAQPDPLTTPGSQREAVPTQPLPLFSRQEVEAKLTQLANLQILLERVVTEPGHSKFRRALIYSEMTIGHMLDIRGAAIVPVLGVRTALPDKVPGKSFAVVDGKIYHYDDAEFPEHAQIFALYAQHREWSTASRAGTTSGPEPTIPADLLKSLFDRGHLAADALRKAGPP